MKKVLLMLVVVAALGIAVVLTDRGKDGGRGGSSPISDVAIREKLLPELDTNRVAEVRLEDAEGGVTLQRGSDRWTVAERGGYPVAWDKLRGFLLGLEGLKISQRYVVSDGATAALGRLRLLVPGGEGEVEDVEAGSGMLVRLKGEGEAGKVTEFVVGTSVEEGGQAAAQSPFGGMTNDRFVKIPGEKNTAWIVSEPFRGIDPEPSAWLDKKFFSVSDIARVEVEDHGGGEGWAAVREDRDGDFELEGLAEGEEADVSKLSSLKFAFSSPSFQDVRPADEVEGVMEGGRSIVLETFDGIRYELGLKQIEGEDDRHHLTVSASGNFAEQREQGGEEDEAAREAADAAFALELERKRGIVGEAARFGGWVYEVSGFVVSAVNRGRGELLKGLEEEGGEGGFPPFLEGGIEGIEGGRAPEVPLMLEGVEGGRVDPGEAGADEADEVDGEGPEGEVAGEADGGVEAMAEEAAGEVEAEEAEEAEEASEVECSAVPADGEDGPTDEGGDRPEGEADGLAEDGADAADGGGESPGEEE